MKVTLSRRARASAVGAVMAAVVAMSSACGGFQSVPLPGGVDVGDNPREYKIEFANILDLVPQSMVKMDGVPIGRVTEVEVPQDSWNALVTVSVRNNVDLSDKATAGIQQTNLLGEKFVALNEPEGTSASTPRQPSSQVIKTARTSTTTDIEQLLGALSMLLNGGGINQLEPIITSINESIGNDPGRFASLLRQTETLISGLNAQRDDIIRAIDGVDRLSSRANDQTDQIERILDELPAGVEVLEEQRPQFVDLLTKLDDLGQVGTDVLGKSHDAIITDLKALRPILSELSKSAQDAVTALPLLPTVPFPDDLLPAVQGDSTNLFITLDLRLQNQLEALGVGQGTPKYSPPSEHPPKVNQNNPYINGNGPRWGWPTISLLPPPLNSRPGPNTPPSGGRYPASAAEVPTNSDQTTKKSQTTKKPSKKKTGNQYSVTSSESGGSFLDAPISMMRGEG
ncbi:MCE family protein [Gordonia sp. HY442]|uniref:MCE family protein n=1 Tax=Gordonia zhenghanii TaxID=2911516 RepID=UPI001F1B2775|nr:MCE family protein [Gordonia zhenghanii]MCF8605453.1 MCE family protein [Gordonia zhenghanii]